MRKYLVISLMILVGLIAYFTSKTPNEIGNVEPIQTSIESKNKFKAPVLPELNNSMPNFDDLDDFTKEIIAINLGNLDKRTNLVHSLKSRVLNEKDFQAFYAFLKINPPKNGAQLGWHSLKNELLVYLINDGRYKESTSSVMIEIINENQQHEVMREYILQYVDDFFERHWLTRKSKDQELTDISKSDQDLQDTLLETVWNQLERVEGPIAGTALVGLNDISRNFSVVNQQRLNQATEKLVLDKSFPVSTRMAAMSVAKERKLDYMHSLISEEAFESNNTLSLRMAAINAASNLGPNENFFKRLKEEIIDNHLSHRVLKRAAQMTINNFKNTRG